MASSTNVKCRLPAIWLEMVETYVKSLPAQSLPKITQMMPSNSKERTDPDAYLIPPIIFWSPLEMYPNVEVICNICNEELSPMEWTASTHSSINAIRTIHGVHSPTLLVSRMYKCNKKHVIIAHNASILNKIPSETMMPFQLSHKSGFTNEFAMFIYEFAATSVSLRKITKILENNREHFYLQRIQLYKAICNTDVPRCPTFIDWKERFSMCQFNTNHSVMAASYVHTFSKLEKLYEMHMSDVSLDKDIPILSCDHTFKSAGKQSPQ